MQDPLLVQYQVLSDQRLHFGRLYWQSIAFLFALLLGGIAILEDLSILPLSIGLMLTASLCGLMGFVAHRLKRLEQRYEAALEAIEVALQEKGHSDIQVAPKSGQYGARFAVTIGLFALSAVLYVLSALELFGTSILLAR